MAVWVKTTFAKEKFLCITLFSGYSAEMLIFVWEPVDMFCLYKLLLCVLLLLLYAVILFTINLSRISLPNVNTVNLNVELNAHLPYLFSLLGYGYSLHLL